MANIIVPVQISLRFGDDYVGVSGENLMYNCIFCEEKGHSPDTQGKLWVHTKKLVYHCFRCNSRGNVKGDAKGYTFDKIYTDDDLYEILEAILEKRKNTSTKIELPYSIPKLRPVPGTYAWDYLIGRGITPEMMVYYDIRVGSVVSKYKNRVIIPNVVRQDSDGNDMTDMFVARYMGEIPKDMNGKNLFGKYLNPFGENKNKCVFNLSRIPKGKPIIITEGVFSGISAGASAVATYGKYISDIQLDQILANEPNQIFVALDPDAYDEAVKLCERIQRRVDTPVRLVKMPEGNDPSDLGFYNFMQILVKSPLYSKSSNAVIDILE